jgi:hypothetical protein
VAGPAPGAAAFMTAVLAWPGRPPLDAALLRVDPGAAVEPCGVGGGERLQETGTGRPPTPPARSRPRAASRWGDVRGRLATAEPGWGGRERVPSHGVGGGPLVGVMVVIVRFSKATKQPRRTHDDQFRVCPV